MQLGTFATKMISMNSIMEYVTICYVRLCAVLRWWFNDTILSRALHGPYPSFQVTLSNKKNPFNPFRLPWNARPYSDCWSRSFDQIPSQQCSATLPLLPHALGTGGHRQLSWRIKRLEEKMLPTSKCYTPIAAIMLSYKNGTEAPRWKWVLNLVTQLNQPHRRLWKGCPSSVPECSR